MKRRIIDTSTDGKQHIVAEVELLEDGGVKVHYEDDPPDPWLQDEVETVGIVADGELVRVRDGRRFFDALPAAYANSTYRSVIDV